MFNMVWHMPSIAIKVSGSATDISQAEDYMATCQKVIILGICNLKVQITDTQIVAQV